MEIEDFNTLNELEAINEEYFRKAVLELTVQNKLITPENIIELFEIYNSDLASTAREVAGVYLGKKQNVSTETTDEEKANALLQKQQ